MSDPSKHHFVPIFYLKQWADAADDKLATYYRPHKDVVVKRYAPSAVGYERQLYTLEGYAADTRNAIERDYMGPVVDDHGARALKVLLERDDSKLTPELRNSWTRFLISLMVRTPHMVEKITKDAAAGLRDSLLLNPEEYELVRKEGDPPTLLEWVEQHAPALFGGFGKTLIPELTNNEKIGTAIIQMKWWTVLVTHESLDLLTSDSPLHLTHGLGDEQCLVVLPLSPHVVFFATRHEARVQAIMSRKPQDVIASINESMVKQAQQYVYGRRDQHLRFVQNRLREAHDENAKHTLNRSLGKPITADALRSEAAWPGRRTEPPRRRAMN